MCTSSVLTTRWVGAAVGGHLGASRVPREGARDFGCANGCLPPDAAVEDSQERCSCPTPCNLTRYGKEISMVRIPNKGSARYLARKYNKNETYIR